ncbi:MAG TPA: 2-amino-4-hydroxy-6-hydroxymethyldihydropteridine diphosphokinase [Candidatus Coproplasma avistercoris]|nr:2-amino-4-hydroxy-6-hydroxymethyldihydropteridine diphosphokinase [Candidatus Coproplasma avistercoris]
MGKVIVKKLKIKTCHGVNDFEKVKPQLFEFSAEVGCDFYAAAREDDISLTVSYAKVSKLITAVATGQVYDLIETLACRCAEAILDAFPQAVSARVRVDKPHAPVKAKFSSMAAEVFLKRERVFLSLGSSLGDKKAYLDFAVKRLSSVHGITLKKVSSYIETPPYGGVAGNTFLNACAEIETYLPPHALLCELQKIEQEGERTRELRWGDRTLDIDIIFYGRQIICDDVLTVPHADYANRAFVLAPLAQIAPSFICPLSGKTVAAMYGELCGD